MTAHGRIVAICVSARKGERKKPVAHALCRADHGVDGDAHAGPGLRQVSLLACAAVRSLETAALRFAPGDFAENILVDGPALDDIQSGDRLVVENGPEFEVTMLGKQCRDAGCPIRQQTGTCVMPSKGVFARVVRSGALRPGQTITRWRRSSPQ